MVFALLVAAAASAADVQPGLFLPSAAKVDGLTGSVGAGALCDTEAACGPIVQGDLALTDRLVIVAQLPVVFDAGLATAPGTVGVRYNVLDNRFVRLAPFAMYGAPVAWGPLWPFDGLSFGVAAEAGVDALTADLSVPIVGTAMPTTPEALLEHAEAGITVRPLDQHGLRVGVTAMAPSLAYRLETDGLWAEAGGAMTVTGARYGLGRVQAGLRF